MNDGTQPRIIMGVNGSVSSVEALKQAQRITQGLEPTSRPSPAGKRPAWPRNTQPWASRASKNSPNKPSRKRSPPPTARTCPATSLPGSRKAAPVRPLIEASKNANMLVLGRRGHGGFHGLRVGSVSSACITRVHCPPSSSSTPRQERPNTKPGSTCDPSRGLGRIRPWIRVGDTRVGGLEYSRGRRSGGVVRKESSRISGPLGQGPFPAPAIGRNTPACWHPARPQTQPARPTSRGPPAPMPE